MVTFSKFIVTDLWLLFRIKMDSNLPMVVFFKIKFYNNLAMVTFFQIKIYGNLPMLIIFFSNRPVITFQNQNGQ